MIPLCSETKELIFHIILRQQNNLLSMEAPVEAQLAVADQLLQRKEIYLSDGSILRTFVNKDPSGYS